MDCKSWARRTETRNVENNDASRRLVRRIPFASPVGCPIGVAFTTATILRDACLTRTKSLFVRIVTAGLLRCRNLTRRLRVMRLAPRKARRIIVSDWRISFSRSLACWNTSPISSWSFPLAFTSTPTRLHSWRGMPVTTLLHWRGFWGESARA